MTRCACFIPVLTASMLSFSACTVPTASVSPQPVPKEASAPPSEETKTSLPVGTVFRVRLYHAIDTSRAQNGDSFLGSLSTPVTVNEKPVVPQGTVVRGSIQQVPPSVRPKSRGSVILTLDRMEWNGTEVTIDTNGVTWTNADHKKHVLAWIGRGAAAGALIGGLLGGGKDAGMQKEHVHIPAESILTFRLAQPIAI